ncbi:MAG: ABC transporter substrate-binding protein [Deltaproteobacteria bacterium]|jgi:branched-chain amino acid transport system substrate-binding protein|nr:ABC transporter substrate-binding protein [Deltaproteobacteria bacterium]
MKTFIRILTLVVFLASAFALALPAAEAADAKTFKIGILGPMSGPAVAWGLPAKHGVEIWVEDIKKAGGLKVKDDTYMPEVVVYDDENVSSKAILGSRKLLLEEKVDLVLQLGGDPAIATGPFFTKNNMVSHTFISTDVRAQFPYLVVPVESVPFFIGALEWIVKAYPDAKTMAHVAQDDLTGIEGATYTYAGAKANNIKIVYDKFFAPETQDFAPIVSAMLAKKPDIVNLGCSYVEYVDLIVEQLYKQGFEGIITAVEFMQSTIDKVPSDWLEARKAIGCFPRFDDPVIKDRRIGERSFGEFYNEFVKRWPGEWGAVSYEWAAGLDLWRHGMKLAGTIDSIKVLKAIQAEKTSPHTFGTGRWMGKDFAGIDNLLLSDWHWTEYKDGKNQIGFTMNVADWMEKNKEIYKEAYKKYKLGKWSQ